MRRGRETAKFGHWPPLVVDERRVFVRLAFDSHVMMLTKEHLLYLPDEDRLGVQVGPRRAFEALIRDGRLAAYQAFAPEYEAAVSGAVDASARLLALANSFQPTIVLWSHPPASLATSEIVARLRSLDSSPTIVLQDMDPWGMVRKRLTPNTRLLAKEADLVYLSGTGRLARVFRRAGAARVRYAFDGFDGERFGKPWSPTAQREYDVVMIGQRNRGRIPGSALPGAWRRERLAELLERQYGPRFALYGDGWAGHPSWKGPLAFEYQGEANRSAWVSAMWDHFPAIANYTSNRVPISLASGVPHVTNYRPGFELIYPPGSGLYWGKTVRSVAEMVAVVLAMPRKDLLAIGEHAACFAREHRSQEALMVRLVEDVSAFRSATSST